MKEISAENTQESKASYSFSPKQSDWGAISSVLLGKISLCDKAGKRIDGSPIVSGVTIDADMTIEAQYSSPFENSNPESRLPTLMGMLQAGDWVNTVDTVLGNVGLGGGTGLSDDAKDKLNQLEGRSNFTKVNSTQIYVASSPIRLNVSMFFEAWNDALHEVEHQVATLQQFASAEHLSDDSLVASVANNASISSLFPSKVPPFVSFTYGGKRYAPLLLESVSAPLVTPLDPDGNRLVLEVNLTLVSRTAWDKTNISALY